MKAIAAFPKTREVKLIDHPEPRLVHPTDVKIKILNVGVCGTDREIWEFKYGTPPPVSDYLITGHESFGQVIEVGPAVRLVKVGDFVVPTVRRGCPENCMSCEQMRQDFCYTGHFTERGIKGAHGFMTEFVVDDEKYMNIVPPELKDFAVLLEPLTIAEKALMQVYTIQARLPWECRLEQGGANQTCHNGLQGEHRFNFVPVGSLDGFLKSLKRKITRNERTQRQRPAFMEFREVLDAVLKGDFGSVHCAQYHLIFEHDIPHERAGVDRNIIHGRRHTRKYKNPILSKRLQEFERCFGRSGRFKNQIRISEGVGHLLSGFAVGGLVMGANGLGECRFGVGSGFARDHVDVHI